jgi:hypothetical protein
MCCGARPATGRRRHGTGIRRQGCRRYWVGTSAPLPERGPLARFGGRVCVADLPARGSSPRTAHVRSLRSCGRVARSRKGCARRRGIRQQKNRPIELGYASQRERWASARLPEAAWKGGAPLWCVAAVARPLFSAQQAHGTDPTAVLD